MYKLLLLLITVLGIVILFVRLMENRIVFFPTMYPSGLWNISQLAQPPVDHFLLTSDKVKIHSWYFAGEPDKPTVLFFHGNAGNVSDRLLFFMLLREEFGVSVFAPEYRGYGKSHGSPTEKGVYRDAQTAYSYLVDSLHTDPEKIIIWGHSLGGAVAVHLSQNLKQGKLVCESTFSSGDDMAKRMFAGLPVGILTSIKFNSVEKIKSVSLPKLFLHGDRDSIVPFDLGKKLYDAAPDPKAFITLAEADHNDAHIMGDGEYWQHVRTFLLESPVEKH